MQQPSLILTSGNFFERSIAGFDVVLTEAGHELYEAERTHDEWNVIRPAMFRAMNCLAQDTLPDYEFDELSTLHGVDGVAIDEPHHTLAVMSGDPLTLLDNLLRHPREHDKLVWIRSMQPYLFGESAIMLCRLPAIDAIEAFEASLANLSHLDRKRFNLISQLKVFTGQRRASIK